LAEDPTAFEYDEVYDEAVLKQREAKLQEKMNLNSMSK